MKYKSDIIKELHDRDGYFIVPSSSTIPYESEYIKHWIDTAIPNYPKLNDYEGEWLNYNLNNPDIGVFPYTTFIGTKGMVENVVPYDYKSAILKGNTLVNIHPPVYNIKSPGSSLTIFYADVNLKKEMFKTNTKYFVRLYNTDSAINRVYMKHCVTDRYYISENKYAIFTTKSEFADDEFVDNKIHFYSPNSVPLENVANTKILICEYQEGMENWDIPYFEGMQSVKMPVLTTSNEDGTKTNILTVNEEVELRGVGEVQDTLDCLTGELTQRIGEIVLDGSEEWLISGSTRPNYLRAYCQNKSIKQYQNVINDKFADNGNMNGKDIEGIYMSNTIDIQVEHSRLTEVSINGLKQWLGENNIKVQARLSQESIKTVDLTTKNQNGDTVRLLPIEGTMNITTSGKYISPTFEAEIPIEATIQNLNSFINEVE